jgi:thioredoxin-related protein
MVDVCVSEAIAVSNRNDICVIKEENDCVYCYKLKQELEVTLQEFS